jgi:hypothetical protein
MSIEVSENQKVWNEATVRRENFKSLVAELEAAPPAAVIETASGVKTTTPFVVDDLKWLDSVQAHRDSSGKRPYAESSKVRADVERLRIAVLNGQLIPPDVRAATQAAMSGKPIPQKFEAVAPQGTPEERAAAERAATPDADGFIPVAALAAEHLHGYVMPAEAAGLTIQLEDASAQFKAARAAGFTQAQVDSYIRQRTADV